MVLEKTLKKKDFYLNKKFLRNIHLSGIQFRCGVKFSLRLIKLCKCFQRNIPTTLEEMDEGKSRE